MTTPEALFVELLRLVPNYDVCRCGRTMERQLTEDDAAAIIGFVNERVAAGESRLNLLEALSPLIFDYTVHELAHGDECRCHLLPAPPAPRSGFHLYRLWADGGRLLYVGVSTSLRARLRSHQRRLGDLLHHATWEEHEDAATMLAAEREAIRDEDPALNRSGVS